MFVLLPGYFLPRRHGATVRVHRDSIELMRGSRGLGRYKLQDCSWFVGTPRHDTGVARAWSLVFPNPKVILIEFPERGWFHDPTQLAAVGWTDKTFRAWERHLLEAEVPEGKGQSKAAERIDVPG